MFDIITYWVIYGFLACVWLLVPLAMIACVIDLLIKQVTSGESSYSVLNKVIQKYSSLISIKNEKDKFFATVCPLILSTMLIIYTISQSEITSKPIYLVLHSISTTLNDTFGFLGFFIVLYLVAIFVGKKIYKVYKAINKFVAKSEEVKLDKE